MWVTIALCALVITFVLARVAIKKNRHAPQFARR